jgi:hypothetical protein
MNTHSILILGLTVALAGVAVSAAEKAADPHAGHKTPAVNHAAMGHGPAAVTDGPWSYKGRDNPAPTKTGRWEMVPVPEYGHMFISTKDLSKALTCAALDNPGVMVDRATRAACGLPASAVRTSIDKAAPAVDHSKMKH